MRCEVYVHQVAARSELGLISWMNKNFNVYVMIKIYKGIIRQRILMDKTRL